MKDKIIQARNEYSNGNKKRYDDIKKTIPCFTFNFTFEKYKKTENIKASTGLIYLDIDNETDINLDNPYIFASWKSLSNNGRGILVRVNGLTEYNFSINYETIAKGLGVTVDKHAGKPTQFCIHSYDEGLYFNDDSEIWNCISDEKKNPKHSYPSSSLIKNKDRNEMGVKNKIHFNNIDSYNFKGEPFIYFEYEKELTSTVNVPKTIKDGARNIIISSIAYQIKAINPDIGYNDLSGLVHSVNINKCEPMLEKAEIDMIINKIFSLDNPTPILNEERRIIFNPKLNLSRKEKAKILNPLLGKKRSEKTIQSIKECLDSWDLLKYGKVTQKSLTSVTGLNIKTVQKYYRLFDKVIININQKLKFKSEKKLICK